MTLLFTLFGLGFDSGGVLDDRVDVHRADSSERRADPVDDAVLHVGVALAAELEAGGEDGVEVASGRAKGCNEVFVSVLVWHDCILL